MLKNRKKILWFKNPWYKPEETYNVKPYGHMDYTGRQMIKSEVYELLDAHIQKYNYYKERLDKMNKPALDKEYEVVFKAIIEDECNNDNNDKTYMDYAGKFGIDPHKLRKLYFELGTYLSNIIEYDESHAMFKRNVDNELEYIHYLQRLLKIGVE